jgi:hypothetical protein
MAESLQEAISIHQPFKENKYLNWYLSLISKEYDGKYTEKHHILPKSLFPDYIKSPWNLVRLDYRAHFIAHLLLPRIVKDIEHERKMLWAVNRFRVKGKYFNSRLYEYVRRRISELGVSAEQVEKVASKIRGRKLTDEHKRKISEKIKSLDIPHPPMSEESKQKMRESKKKSYVLKYWMNKDGKQIKVLPNEVDKYISNGWKRGISRSHVTEEFREKIRNKTKEQWQKLKETGHTGHLIKA